jgi:hypothetical protein
MEHLGSVREIWRACTLTEDAVRCVKDEWKWAPLSVGAYLPENFRDGRRVLETA